MADFVMGRAILANSINDVWIPLLLSKLSGHLRGYLSRKCFSIASKDKGRHLK